MYRLTEPVRINASWHLCEMLITCNSDPTPGRAEHTGLLVESRSELVDGGRDAQTLEQHGLLALQTHVFGPLDEASQVPFRLDVATCKQSQYELFAFEKFSI